MMNEVEVDGVSVDIGGRSVLNGISLRVARGEIVGVVGPSGSGKSTLLRAITGLAVPSRGVVRLEGHVASSAGVIHVPPESRRIGMVFQDLALWPHLNVREQLAFGLRARGVDAAERERRIGTLLGPLGLMEKRARYPGQLSGGERQRVAIARALVTQPTTVLLDEPLSHLDVQLRRELLDVFRGLLRARRVTTLYVTHDLREVQTLADRLIVLERGVVVQEGTLEELRSAPADEFVRELFADLDGKPSLVHERPAREADDDRRAR